MTKVCVVIFFFYILFFVSESLENKGVCLPNVCQIEKNKKLSFTIASFFGGVAFSLNNLNIISNLKKLQFVTSG